MITIIFRTLAMKTGLIPEGLQFPDFSNIQPNFGVGLRANFLEQNAIHLIIFKFRRISQQLRINSNNFIREKRRMHMLVETKP